jgi:monoamine oxidase
MAGTGQASRTARRPATQAIAASSARLRSGALETTTDLAIIGGGLSGLALAGHAAAAGLDWTLAEARPRLGGRAFTVALGEGRVPCDGGPAWLWPHDVRARALAHRAGLHLFAQHATGHLIYEDEAGAVRRDLDFATMGGALRVAGGMGRLVDALAGPLPPSRLRLGVVLTGLERAAPGWRLGFADGSALTARRVAFAAPPRLLAAHVALPAEIGPDARAAMQATPTWMAGQAKVVAVYDSPFWRAEGFSGDAISRRGPLVEIHDASPAEGAAGALFGFVGVPPAAREGRAQELVAAAVAQLGALFGPRAARPVDAGLADWADEPFTTVPHDLAAPGAHPPGGVPRPLAALAGIGLVFAGAEFASAHPGLVEGALEAAEAAFALLRD